MEILQFIKDISWQLVILVALLMSLLYRKPIGDLISNIRKGSYSSKKGEGVSIDLEVERPTSVPPSLTDTRSLEVTEVQTAEIVSNSAELMVVEVMDEKSQTPSWLDLVIAGEYQEAYRLLLELVKDLEQDKSTNPLFLKWLRGQVAEVLSKFDYLKAKEEYEFLIRKDQDYIYYHMNYFEMLGNAGDLSRINSIIDSYPGSKSNKYTLMLWKANYFYGRSNFDNAMTIADELILQDDNNEVKARAHILKGKILKKDNPNESKKWFIKAYSITPTDKFTLREIAEIFSEMNEHKLELFIRKALLGLEQDNLDNWGLIGNTYLSLNMFSHAMDAYEKANVLGGGNVQWIVANIGNLYNNVKLYSKAIEFLNSAVTLKPLDEYATNRLSLALSNKEKEEKKFNEIMNEVRALISKNYDEQEN